MAELITDLTDDDIRTDWRRAEMSESDDDATDTGDDADATDDEDAADDAGEGDTDGTDS